METLIYCYLPISYLIMLGYIFEIMGNTSMICDYIENEWNRQNHAEEYDLDDVQLVW